MNVENPERPRRHSGQQLQQVRRETVERRSSKNSASRDRYGKIYSESFRDQTIRAVPPELPPTTSHDIDVPSSSYASNPVSPSPRVLRRTKLPQRRREPSTSVSNTDEETTIDSRRRKSKARDKKLEDSPSESSPNSFMTKTRQRIGSITTSTSLIQKTAEDLSGSIGYPSIIQSPVRPPQSASRQRLAKAIPHTPLSAHEDPVTDSSPSPQQTTNGSDSSKILQTMKTTCGRMHGILFFRPTYTAPWASGYCAINVASGSLIYQVKGELSNTKTLIPDLRGCSVRTLCDAESGRMYLSVSTASSGLGIQLRPSVPETFDSWLAALLCWQPIRPKGVQNKMTKPQSFSMVGRRSADRRRTSEVTVQKSSPIIKVGKMLLWQGSTSADPDPDSSKRVSTYKQLRAISPCWQRVSCTLNENGHFKLLTEGDAQLIMFIQLSHLSRCSVQQLDPSVLDDEFCIALYPQYTAYTGSQVQSRPIFLSLETRVLFEVWFVLLRAFTIPELYGPKQSPNDESSPSSPTYQHAAATPPGMFRIERSLFVRVTEAKLKGPFEHREPSMKVRGKAGSATRALSNRDCYAEILLDGGIRARTATKTHQSSAFWREEFMFSDLSPVLSTASVLIKYRNPAEKEWTMIPRGQYDPSQGDSSSVAVGAEIEVSAYDTVYGRVDLQLDDFDKGIDVDRWWQVLGANGLVVGDLLMKIRLEETVVLMKDDYTPLLNLLQSFSNGLTVQIARVLSTKLNQLTDIFLDLFQVSALASEWIMSLVEDEIDGLSREGPTNRLRWSTRMQSNDSYESSENREILVRDLGRSAAIEANLLFRGNSLLTKALDSHMRRLGKDYLEETIGERLRDIDESDPECEVDPNRVRAPNELNRNWTNLIALTSHVWRAIAASATRCPPELRLLFRHIRSCAEDRYGAFLRTVSYSSVSGFLFLRFFCPAILNPKLFGLLKAHPRPKAHRTLTLIAKSLQGLANMTTFGSKESWMEPMNKFLMASRSEFKEFVDQICSISTERPTQALSPSYATPIQILGRLPATSREGFPSLPYLIDSPIKSSVLISLWIAHHPAHVAEAEEHNNNLRSFHNLCFQLQQRTRECLNQAEQAERPSGGLEPKWERLLEERLKTATIFNETTSKPGILQKDLSNHRHSQDTASVRWSNGYSPHTDNSQGIPDISSTREARTPTSTASATWDQYPMSFPPEPT